MRPAEAQWVERVLKTLPAASLSPLIEFGASKDFREVEKPHIERHVHGPCGHAPCGS